MPPLLAAGGCRQLSRCGSRPRRSGSPTRPPARASARPHPGVAGPAPHCKQQGARCRAGPPLAPTDWPPGCPEPSPGWQGIAATRQVPSTSPNSCLLTVVTRKGDATLRWCARSDPRARTPRAAARHAPAAARRANQRTRHVRPRAPAGSPSRSSTSSANTFTSRRHATSAGRPARRTRTRSAGARARAHANEGFPDTPFHS